MGQSQCHSSSKNSSVLYLATLILTSTKMGEIESAPLPVAVVGHAEIGIHLKIVEKAVTIPLVNDAVTAVTPIITEAVTAATNLHTQVREANTVYNTVEDLILGGIKEATPTITESVPEVVKTTLATTVDQLDTLACDGLDKLTTTIPQLNEPTQEIITNTTGEIVTVVNDVTDYVTSFSIAQWGLKTTDNALDVTEKVLHTLEPSDDPDTPLSPIFTLPLVATFLSCVKPTVAKVRALRRYLRSLRHGGRRRACATADETTIGGFLETFYINILLSTVFGIRIAPLSETTTDDLPLATSGKRKTPEPEDVEEETVVMLSDEKIAEYDEAQDPDYEPTEETPDEPLEYDSQAEISQEHIADEEVTEGTTVEEVAEEIVEATEESQEIVTEESQEIVTEESSQEGTVEDGACNPPACEKVVVEGKHVVVEEVKPMGTLEDETTGQVEETTDLAEEVHTTETTDVTEEVLTTETTETTDMTEEVHTTETTDMTEEAHTTETTETTDMTEEVLTTDMTGEVVTETTGEEVHITETTDMTGEVETGEVVTETTGEEVHTTNTTEMTGEVEHTTDMEATS